MKKTLVLEKRTVSLWAELGRLTVVLFAVILLGCKNDAPVSAPPIDYNNITNIVYSGHVQPLLSATCATSGCHDVTTRAAGLALVSWNEIIKGSRYGEVIMPFQAQRNLLTMLFDGTSVRKPHPALGGRRFFDRRVDGSTCSKVGPLRQRGLREICSAWRRAELRLAFARGSGYNPPVA